MGCVSCCLRENTLEDQEHQIRGCLHLYRYVQLYFDLCHSVIQSGVPRVVPSNDHATLPLVPISQVNTEDNNTAILLSQHTSVSVRHEKVAKIQPDRKEQNGSTDEERSNTCHSGSLQPSPRMTDGVTCLYPSSYDEDACPICLEEYTTENPRSTLQCSHQFHLCCVYEWMERSDACPFCSELMLFKEDV
ncbi:E3 ubiquitin-protein ligase At3g02290-like [Zingiber officinale]|uniref:RING-type E3 ubiquitin transferase n=1 Tax=Zingiber officinale TaxID=94328 RepID=A0A8J5LV61_ZINOF|nr:E3 ubiquitin-protein ligase At3g02290-like [Zingiber officinale]KAG6524206.1 hypothetical protein ZIOFF_014098 [Zingiber officinale]